MDSSTQTDKIYKQLLEAIVSGDIAPGSRLRETDLARELDIGRGPLREAIHRLESRRMVTKAAHIGAQVVNLDLTELIEIYQIRENLEGLACEFAAKHMTDDELSRLGRLLEEHAVFLERNDGESYIDQNSDLDFHFQIIQSSRNSWLIRLLCDELYHRVRMYRYQSAQHRSRPHEALEEHQRIYQALKSRDGELASLLMKRHISKARLTVEKRIAQKITGEMS
jgi:DNA-binding GntR family transcriptional regulator